MSRTNPFPDTFYVCFDTEQTITESKFRKLEPLSPQGIQLWSHSSRTSAGAPMLCRLAIPRLELSEKDYVNIVDRVKRLLKNHGLSLLGDPELLISHTTLKSVKL